MTFFSMCQFLQSCDTRVEYLVVFKDMLIGMTLPRFLLLLSDLNDIYKRYCKVMTGTGAYSLGDGYRRGLPLSRRGEGVLGLAVEHASDLIHFLIGNIGVCIIIFILFLHRIKFSLMICSFSLKLICFICFFVCLYVLFL